MLDLDGLTASFQAHRLRRRRRRRRDPRGAPAGLARRAPGVRSVSHARCASPTSPPCAAVLAALLGAARPCSSRAESSGNGLIPAANAGPLRSDFEAVAKAAQAGNGNCTATTEADRQNRTGLRRAALDDRRGTAQQRSARASQTCAHARSKLCAQPLAQTTTTSSTAHDDDHDDAGENPHATTPTPHDHTTPDHPHDADHTDADHDRATEAAPRRPASKARRQGGPGGGTGAGEAGGSGQRRWRRPGAERRERDREGGQ